MLAGHAQMPAGPWHRAGIIAVRKESPHLSVRVLRFPPARTSSQSGRLARAIFKIRSGGGERTGEKQRTSGRQFHSGTEVPPKPEQVNTIMSYRTHPSSGLLGRHNYRSCPPPHHTHFLPPRPTAACFSHCHSLTHST